MDNKIGCHVRMSAPDYLLGSVNAAIEFGANAFMIYTGAPQNFKRVDLKLLKINEFKQKMNENNLALEDVIVHAPYVMNLATNDLIKHKTSIELLALEIYRANQIGLKYFVLHPGNNIDVQKGIQQIAYAINFINKTNKNVVICLETMSGKGNEIGRNFLELKQIIDLVIQKDLIGVCLDTCHINDAGYDVKNVKEIIENFNQQIGIKFLKVIHLNDSKNIKGAKKDRHENIGMGTIGLETLKAWVNCPDILNLPKILETPYIDDLPPYKQEIELLRNK